MIPFYFLYLILARETYILIKAKSYLHQLTPSITIQFIYLMDLKYLNKFCKLFLMIDQFVLNQFQQCSNRSNVLIQKA